MNRNGQRNEFICETEGVSNCLDQKPFGFWYYSIFVFIRQLLSTHKLTMLKNFISQITDKLCNYLFFYLYLIFYIYAARFNVIENLKKFWILM